MENPITHNREDAKKNIITSIRKITQNRADKQVKGHLIGGTPGHICVGVGEGCRRNLSVLLEHGLGVGEGHRRAGVGKNFY